MDEVFLRERFLDVDVKLTLSLIGFDYLTSTTFCCHRKWTTVDTDNNNMGNKPWWSQSQMQNGIRYLPIQERASEFKIQRFTIIVFKNSVKW